jgi:Ca2+/H+ antiporter
MATPRSHPRPTLTPDLQPTSPPTRPIVAGMCFLFGGMQHKQQTFNTLANKVSSSLLFLACIAIIIPSTAKMFYGKEVREVLGGRGILCGKAGCKGWARCWYLAEVGMAWLHAVWAKREHHQ